MEIHFLKCVKCERFKQSNEIISIHRDANFALNKALFQNNELEIVLCNTCFAEEIIQEEPCDYQVNYLNKEDPEFKENIEITYDDIEIANKQYQRHQHFSQDYLDGVLTYICALCGQIGVNVIELQAHINAPGSFCLDAKIEQKLLKNVFTCEYCCLDFKYPRNLQTHRATGVHSDLIFHCPVCDKAFFEIGSLNNHKRCHPIIKERLEKLPPNRLYLCNIGDCVKMYQNWVLLRQHKIRSHVIQKCSECNKTFDSMKSYNAHIQESKNHSPYKCEPCDEYFLSKMSLSVHCARRHSEGNIICEVCGACFRNQQALEFHDELWHKTIVCGNCHKKYKNRRTYEQHLRNHCSASF